MQKDFEDVRGKWSESQQSLKVTLQQLHQIQQEQQHQQQEQQVQHQNHSEVEGGDSTKSLASSESIPPPEAELVISANESVLQQLFKDNEELINKLKDSHSPAPSVTSQHNFGEEDETGSVHAENRESFVSDSSKVKKVTSKVSEDEDRESWDLPPVSLKELGWLTDHQAKMVEKRMQTDTVSKTHEHDSNKRSSLSIFSGVTKAVFGESHHHTENTSVSTTAASSSSSATTTRRTSMFSAMFGGGNQSTPVKPKESVDHTHTGETETARTISDSTSSVTSTFFASPFSMGNQEEEETGRLPVAMRLTCLRCHGSVEGPKFSTCKCDLPALTPDDLHHQPSSSQSTTSSLYALTTGLFSKSTHVAGEVAVDIVKVTANSMEGLIGFTNNPMNENKHLAVSNTRVVDNNHGTLSTNDSTDSNNLISSSPTTAVGGGDNPPPSPSIITPTTTLDDMIPSSTPPKDIGEDETTL